jgi:hypothetical protein
MKKQYVIYNGFTVIFHWLRVLHQVYTRAQHGMSLPIQRSAFGTAISLSKRVGGPFTAPRLPAGAERGVYAAIKCNTYAQGLTSLCFVT